MQRLFFLSCSLVIFWLEGWIISFADAQDPSFSLNFVFDEGECNGSQPTVAVSTRLGRSILDLEGLPTLYTRWIPLSGNCSAVQNLSFSLSTMLADDIGILGSRRYQFRIDLSPADHCHCLTVDSATGVIGNVIFNQWRDGSLGCGSNITRLCASNSENTTFYSALMQQNGLLSGCDDSTDTSLDYIIQNVNVQIPVFRTCRGLLSSIVKCAADGDWGQTTRCSVSSRLATDSKNCSLLDTNVTISRVCHCNGEWGEVYCHTSLQLVEELLESSLPEDSLVILSQLLPNTTTITQRLDLLMRAVQQQLNTTQGITDTFLQLVLNIVEDIPNKLEASLSEDSLVILSQLLPNTTTITQRLDLLTRAVQRQLNTTQGITDTSLQLLINIVASVGDELLEANIFDSVQFLSLLDKVALNLRQNITVTSLTGKLIRVRIREVFPGSGRVTGIQVDNNYITLPGEIFEDIIESVFVASFYFENISNLLPEGAQEPVSPVISSTLDCNRCKTSDLSENVTICFDLNRSPGTNDVAKCVFADVESYRRGDGANFWNDSGCTTMDFKNGSVMCSCNHLTHFGVLFGAGVGTGDEPNAYDEGLEFFGQALVSISLVFLLATILTFVLHKSLWNMRNYIHCMLCGSMFTAQLVFVVGIDRTGNEALCSAIAVVLHYLFMVVFMWMLMEGVVLYVKLVVVFITHHKRYIVFFTIASFGIPLLYMIPVVPLGFLVNTDNGTGYHYGYYNDSNMTIRACWLRDDFIWAFIAPIILVILVNIGFLIMALVIMYRHLRKHEKKSKGDTAKHWLKVVTSLVIVMGIGWIGNIVLFNNDSRVIAYIMSGFIASQGVFIFILLVPLSKQVRDAYINWGRKIWTRFSTRNGRLSAKPSSPMNSKENGV